MTNPDQIMVRPTSTYYDQGERKSAESEPYLVTRAHGEELKGLGIAEVVEPPALAEPEAPPASPPAAEPDSPPADEPDSRPRGRRGPARD